MANLVDEARSIEIAKQINSKAKKPFDNAYRAALATKGAIYVQGFLAAAGKVAKPIEHAWVEVKDAANSPDETRIVDPTLPYLNRAPQNLHYFAAQRLTVKQLKAAIEEAKEDYPEDDPLPIYGTAPYKYYGDVMLGGKEYLEAHEAALTKCTEMNQQIVDRN